MLANKNNITIIAINIRSKDLSTFQVQIGWNEIFGWNKNSNGLTRLVRIQLILIFVSSLRFTTIQKIHLPGRYIITGLAILTFLLFPSKEADDSPSWSSNFSLVRTSWFSDASIFFFKFNLQQDLPRNTPKIRHHCSTLLPMSTLH